MLGGPEAETWLKTAALQDQLKRTIVNSVSTIESDRRLFYNLGMLCEALGRLEEARVWYRIAIERDSLDAEAQQGLARMKSAGRGGTSTARPSDDSTNRARP